MAAEVVGDAAMGGRERCFPESGASGDVSEVGLSAEMSLVDDVEGGLSSGTKCGSGVERDRVTAARKCLRHRCH